MIRLPTRLKELFRKEGTWWGFFEKYKQRMCPAIVDNVLKMLSCGLTVRGYAVFQCSNLECSAPEESLLQLQEPVLPHLQQEAHRSMDRGAESHSSGYPMAAHQTPGAAHPGQGLPYDPVLRVPGDQGKIKTTTQGLRSAGSVRKKELFLSASRH